MGPKRGLSADEKKSRLLEIFYERKDVFQLKELEKIAPKDKGIVLQSVKEVLQSLVDDNLVCSEKIGSSTYFWSFPSDAFNKRKVRLDELKANLIESTKKLKATEEELSKATVGKEDGEERVKKLNELETLTKEEEDLKNKVDKYKDCDPVIIKGLKDEIKQMIDSANKSTDNIFEIKSWCKKKIATYEEKTFNKQFEIPEELDYVE